MSEDNKSSCENILDFVENQEDLIRLLCTPDYYNEEIGMVTPDAFDLRNLGKRGPESYVSLGRCKYLDTQEKLEKYLKLGDIIWRQHAKQKNTYYGYGIFCCQDAREVHDMVEINPVEEGGPEHIGLFYKKPEGGYYSGPLPKTEEVIEMLGDLASIVVTIR